ncbi:MAG TPA: hypothetical protein VK462_03695, partial [Nitrososphaeraceae archaeon]|nr:hypothetical protein [Nitrososphaeraceae archaeon]
VLNDILYSSSYLNLNYVFKTLNVTSELVSAVTVALVTSGGKLTEAKPEQIIKVCFFNNYSILNNFNHYENADWPKIK